jgi:hypothetical protein
MAPDAEHVHPDDLALLALGEHPEDVDQAHLAGCASCRDEVEQLRTIVAGARSVTADDTPVAPPSQVWDAVAAELGLGRDRSASADTDEAAAVVPLARPRRRTALLVAAAAVVGLLVGSVVTGLVVAGGDDEGGVVASADLSALPEHQGSGAVEVVGTGDRRELRLDVTGLTTGDGFYEVWLLDADGKRLVSLGLLDGSTASFPLPPQVDLADFPVVDVSLEPADGNPAHSGDSIVRGTLSS